MQKVRSRAEKPPFPQGIRPHPDTLKLMKHRKLTHREAGGSAAVQVKIGELQMQKARSLMDEGRYSEAAEVFDSAMTSFGQAFSYGVPFRSKDNVVILNNEAMVKKAECERRADQEKSGPTGLHAPLAEPPADLKTNEPS